MERRVIVVGAGGHALVSIEDVTARVEAAVDPGTDAEAANLARRGFEFDADAYLALEERRKSLQVETEALRKERNTSSKAIGKAKAQGEDVEPLLAAVKNLGDQLATNEAALQDVQAQLQDIELGLPNLLQEDVPDGEGEDDNLELRREDGALAVKASVKSRSARRCDRLIAARGCTASPSSTLCGGAGRPVLDAKALPVGAKHRVASLTSATERGR